MDVPQGLAHDPCYGPERAGVRTELCLGYGGHWEMTGAGTTFKSPEPSGLHSQASVLDPITSLGKDHCPHTSLSLASVNEFQAAFRTQVSTAEFTLLFLRKQMALSENLDHKPTRSFDGK